ncbi:MAG: hypothetical protein ABI876_06925 [Bacteroidota bacterium]
MGNFTAAGFLPDDALFFEGVLVTGASATGVGVGVSGSDCFAAIGFVLVAVFCELAVEGAEAVFDGVAGALPPPFCGADLVAFVAEAFGCSGAGAGFFGVALFDAVPALATAVFAAALATVVVEPPGLALPAFRLLFDELSAFEAPFDELPVLEPLGLEAPDLELLVLFAAGFDVFLSAIVRVASMYSAQSMKLQEVSNPSAAVDHRPRLCPCRTLLFPPRVCCLISHN